MLTCHPAGGSLGSDGYSRPLRPEDRVLACAQLGVLPTPLRVRLMAAKAARNMGSAMAR
jgi:hypothetical protein